MVTREEEYEWMEEGNKRLNYVIIMKKSDIKLRTTFTTILIIILLGILIFTIVSAVAPDYIPIKIINGSLTLTIHHEISIAPETYQEINQTLNYYKGGG